MIINLILLIIVVIIVLQIRKGQSEAIGNWSHLFPNMQLDPEEFYLLVEEIIELKEIPDAIFSRRTFKQGSIYSYHRLYFEVSRGDYIFHICAAPWGTGFFFSWWVREKLSLIDAILIMIPIIGPRIVRLRQYKSYYKLDTDTMFRKSVHQSVMEAIDGITKSAGISGLTELERKPDLRAIIK